MSATATKPTRLTGPQRREQILDVTKAMVGERGFHGISIDAVARGAGISRPIVYGHFDDLAGLLRALVEREGARAVEQLMELLPQPDSAEAPRDLLVGGLTRVPRGGARRAGHLAPRPDAARGHARDPARARGPHPPGGHRPARGGGAAGVLVRAGGPPLPDPELTALMLQAIAEDAARLLLDEPEQYPIERLIEHADWMLAQLGLLARSRSRDTPGSR